MSGFRAPTTVCGVDFSGARRAGESIYLARGTAEDGALDIETCVAAPDLFGTDAAREAVLPALRSFLAEVGGGTAFGLDFSFGLPAFLLDSAGVGDWAAFVRWFPDGFADASEFSAWACERAAKREGDRTYYRRETDRAVGATSPYHFFVKAQTFHGVRDVLKPLVETGSARVLPMRDPDPDLPWALEAYPAATLDRIGGHRERYKTDDEAGRRRRAENVTALAALDGVVAAVATWERTRSAERLRPSGTAWRREGHIFS